MTDGRRSAFAAAAAANPVEVADLRADGAKLQPVLAATGGALRWTGDGAEPALPELRAGLKDPDVNIRNACQAAIEAIGKAREVPDAAERAKRTIAIREQIAAYLKERAAPAR